MSRAIFCDYWILHLTCRAFPVCRVVVCARTNLCCRVHIPVGCQMEGKVLSSLKFTCLISETLYIDSEVKPLLISWCTGREAVGGFQGSAYARAFRRSCPLTVRWGSEEFEKMMGVLVFTKAVIFFFCSLCFLCKRAVCLGGKTVGRRECA